MMLGTGNVQLRWQTSETWKSQGEVCLMGKWQVGRWFYNGSRPQDDPKMYKATCKLPGLKADLGSFETTDAARERIEAAVRYWIKNATS